MCRADVEPQAHEAVAKLLRDIAQSLADQENVDLARIRIGPVDSDHPMISGPPHDEGHIDSVHCRLEADRQTMRGEGHPRRNSLSLARRRCWPGQSQGGRSSGASRLESRRRNGRPRRGPASARHPVSRSSRALRHPARRCVRSCRESEAIIDAGALKIDESKEMAEAALVKILIGSSTFAFAGRANAAPMNVESHAGESITGDLMSKAW